MLIADLYNDAPPWLVIAICSNEKVLKVLASVIGYIVGSLNSAIGEVQASDFIIKNPSSPLW
jgi:hypothetical protein